MAALPFWRRAAIIVFWASRHVLHVVITVLTLLLALLLVGSAFSDMVSPTVWMVAAFLGLFFPVILGFAIGWLVVLLLLHRWRMSLVIVLALLLCCGRIWRYCPMHVGQQEAITNEMQVDGQPCRTPVDTFRVLTYNTCATGKAKLWKNDETIPVMELARQSGADVVCFQEYQFSRKGGYEEPQLRAVLQKEYPYYHIVYNSDQKHKVMGVAIFSKWPLVMKEKIDKREEKYCWAGYYELNVRGRRVALVNCHLQSNSISEKNRKLYQEQVEHFQADSLRRMEEGLRQLGPSFRTRTEQVAIINRYIAERRKQWSEPLPMLICGDMNDTPASFAYHAMRGDMADSWQDAGFGPGITFRSTPFWFRIDHVFHSEHFHTLDAEVLRDAKMSDHYPVMVTFQLLPPNE